jgi:hypothetical protein
MRTSQGRGPPHALSAADEAAAAKGAGDAVTMLALHGGRLRSRGEG